MSASDISASTSASASASASTADEHSIFYDEPIDTTKSSSDHQQQANAIIQPVPVSSSIASSPSPTPVNSSEYHDDEIEGDRRINIIDTKLAENKKNEKYVCYLVEYNFPYEPDRSPIITVHRYSQFYALHKYLQKKFVGLPIAFPSRTFRRNLTQTFIEKRRKALLVWKITTTTLLSCFQFPSLDLHIYFVVLLCCVVVY